MKKLISESANSTEKIGVKLTSKLPSKVIVYILGELGVGKTTLVRGIINGLGYGEEITSPTYDLIETYECNNHIICHIDLFRCKSPQEWYEAGINDVINDSTLCLIEWPEKADGLPNADIIINIKELAENNTREILLQAKNKQSEECINYL